MEADFIPLVRLLRIGPYELSILFSRGKPNFENLFDICDSLVLLHEKLIEGLQTIKDTMVRRSIYEHGYSFITRYMEAIREHFRKKRYVLM